MEHTTNGLMSGSIQSVDGSFQYQFNDVSSVDITLPGDNVYMVDIRIQIGETITNFKFILSDFCDLFACISPLIDEIICENSECIDKDKEQKRYSALKMLTIYNLLRGKAFAYRNVFFGEECGLDANKSANEIKVLFDKLNQLAKECGACKKSINVPCKTC